MSADRSNKDKEMAATLKKRGVTRTVCRCPICHNVVALNNFPAHVMKCPGRRR